MPMQQGQQGGMPMMQMIRRRQAMMQVHMQKMGVHMAAIGICCGSMSSSKSNSRGRGRWDRVRK